jgi:RNA polymerase sigma-70 factor, ECF subfamily
METPDEDLVAKCQAGSTAAFEALVRRYQPRLLRFLEGQLGNREDARDITQRSFIQAHASLSRFKPGRRFAPWLFAIARSESIDFLRHVGARQRLSARLEDEPEPSPVSNPASQLDERERVEERWRWIRARLDARSSEILWLHIQEEMDPGGIARVTGLTRSHVKVLLFRARAALRRQLELENGNPFANRPAEAGPSLTQPEMIRP